MSVNNLIKVYGCYNCKHLAGELRKQRSTFKGEVEGCFLCDDPFDFFYLNIETMTFQKGEVAAEEEAEIMSHAQAVTYIMQNSGVDEETAKKIYLEIKMDCVTENCESLREKGLTEIYKYAEDGTPCYRLTKTGEEYYKDKLK